jgi:two-component system response regulator AtoC
MDKILLVDDESHIRAIVSDILAEKQYEIWEAGDGNEALQIVKKEFPDVVLLDYNLPDMLGIEILKKIKEINQHTIVIMLTAYGDLQKAVQAMKLGAYDYLTKPFDNDEILLVVEKALNTQRLTNEVNFLKKQLHVSEISRDMMGESLAIKKVLEMVQLVATNDITVFLEGETGTGKEVIARLIHGHSHRSEKAFVAVDCGAIPDTLFESEMFGHEKGSFTGAALRHLGKFEQADGGTLFLDEISNLPLNMQAKLLRVIQNKTVTRVGGKTMLPVDVRIIVASNKDIVADVESGAFRSDLFYRLHEFKIELPKLSDRKDDIPILSNCFLREFNSEFGKTIRGFTPAAIEKLMNYSWPGNVRELKNVIKRAVLLAPGKSITPEHLIFSFIKSSSVPKYFAEKSTMEDLETEALHIKVAKIHEAIKKANGNKSKAASLLGITRNQMYRLLKKAEDEKLRL